MTTNTDQATVTRLRKDAQAWSKAFDDARTTIKYLEERGAEKQRRIRELEQHIKELERKNIS